MCHLIGVLVILLKEGIDEGMSDVRIRFAPSPTGYLHVGGARTALFCWLYARHTGGTFILRVEDTDIQRSTEESVEAVFGGLKWLGLDWDEGPEVGGDYGPYFQSQRLTVYRKYLDQLQASGDAYYCYCTPEELDQRRQQAQAEGRAPRYDGRCRHLSEEEVAGFKAEGREAAIRFKTPDAGTTIVKDIIRGDVSFENEVFGDFVIYKSDGMPTYNFACVVDDHLMKVSHVLRGEDHISNTPKQVFIYDALGWDLPEFAHVPLILAPDRTRLSKRHGATSVEEYRDRGFLPEAMINGLALLGWSLDGETEIVSSTELIEHFALNRISKTGSVFDIEKFTWLNGQYIRDLPLSRVVEAAIPFFQEAGYISSPATEDELTRLSAIIDSIRDRSKTLVEMVDAASYFYEDFKQYDEKGWNKHMLKPETVDILKAVAARMADTEPFDMATTEERFREIMPELGVKGGQLFHPTRIALSGRTIGPGLFDIMVHLGKEKTLERLGIAIGRVEKELSETL